MPRYDFPDTPPSGPLLPDTERRDRAQALEWMHEAAAPRRKKRTDPPPDPPPDPLWMRKAEHAFGRGIFDDED